MIRYLGTDTTLPPPFHQGGGRASPGVLARGGGGAKVGEAVLGGGAGIRTSPRVYVVMAFFCFRTTNVKCEKVFFRCDALHSHTAWSLRNNARTRILNHCCVNSVCTVQKETHKNHTHTRHYLPRCRRVDRGGHTQTQNKVCCHVILFGLSARNRTLNVNF